MMTHRSHAAAPDPAVSVVIPTFNRAAWLGRTVASVLAQTRPAAEIIVVDDGSSDHTGELAARLAGPVRYIRQDNAGVAAARNRGARAATGDYIAFLDNEDLWVPHKLSTQLAAMRLVPEAAWSVTDCVVIGLDDRPLPGRQGWARVVPAFRSADRAPEAFFAENLDRRVLTQEGRAIPVLWGDAFRLLCFGNFGIPSTALIRRDTFLEHGGFDESFRVAEETEFFHRLSARAPVAVLLAPLTWYRVGQEGTLTSSVNTIELVRNALRSLDSARRARGGLTPDEEAAWTRGRHVLLRRLAYAALASLDRPAARKSIATLRAEGGGSPSATALDLLSRLPERALRGLHRLKRLVT